MSTPGHAAAGLCDECFYCRRAAGLEDDPAGGYEHEHFRVGHADVGIACAGSFVVEARSHVLDIGGMTGNEIASLMALLPKLYQAMHEGLGAERVYRFNPSRLCGTRWPSLLRSCSRTS